MPNLVPLISLIYPSLQILGKTQTGVFLIWNENGHNSRTRHDIYMTFEQVTKLDKKNKATSKNLTMTSCQQIKTSLIFVLFLAILQPSGSRIPDAWSIKSTFPLIVTFYLTKPENRTKKSLTQISYYCFE